MEETVVFIECGADKESANPAFRFTRKHFMWPSEADKFRTYYGNTGVYQTVMHYINPLWFQNERGKWIINAKDSLKIGDFYLDFDTIVTSEADYKKMKADVTIALRYLKVILNIDESNVRFFFSGNKGLHLTVDTHVMDLEPHVALNEIYRDIAKEIEEYCENDTLDTAIYDDKRMFRMVNSINKKSGLHKIPITLEEFKTLSYEELKKLATKPRQIPPANIIPSQKAKLAFKKYVEDWTGRVTRQQEFTGKLTELKVNPPCIQQMLDKTFRETIDERNNSGTALASFYFQQGIERDEVMVRLKQWGESNCMPPLKSGEMEVIVNSVFNGQHRYGCRSFERLSGVCDKKNCPIFNRELNVQKEQPV